MPPFVTAPFFVLAGRFDHSFFGARFSQFFQHRLSQARLEGMFPAAEIYILRLHRTRFIGAEPVKAQVFPHLPQNAYHLGTLVQRSHPGIIVHQVVLALADMEQVGGAGRVLPLDPKGQPGTRQIFAVVGFRTQLLEAGCSLFVAVVKFNGRIGLVFCRAGPGVKFNGRIGLVFCRAGPGGEVGDDIALPFAVFFV